MKKKLFAALLATFTLTTLAACGNNKPDPAPVSHSEASKTSKSETAPSKKETDKYRSISKEKTEVPFKLKINGVYEEIATLSLPSDYILHTWDYLDDEDKLGFKGARRTEIADWMADSYESLEFPPFLYSFSLYDQQGIEQATNAYQDFQVYPAGEEEKYEINYFESKNFENPKELKQGSGEINGISYEYEYIVMNEEDRLIGEYGYTCIYHLKDNMNLCHTTGIAQDDGFDPEEKAKEIGKAITVK